MPDDSVVDEDESKIVTKFLLDTCRQQQISKPYLQAIGVCDILATSYVDDDEEFRMIPVITGSVAEFYIHPMFSCVGDVDIMCHTNDQLAIPDGYTPPSRLPAEFHSRVKACKIVDSANLGYVYLMPYYWLTKNSRTDYDALQDDAFQYLSRSSTLDTAFDTHGPAHKIKPGAMGMLEADRVGCVRCLSWPPQAADWPTRHRNYGWPDLATVDRVVNNGCDVVHATHPLCRQDEWMNKHQWRLSFSRAEIALLNSWMSVQQIVYHMLPVFVKTEQLTDVTDDTGLKILSNYNIKSLMLWACESKPKSWWVDDLNTVGIFVEMLHTLAVWLSDARCPHYFITRCNLFHHATTSCSVQQLVIEFMSSTKAGTAKWFITKYIHRCAELCRDEGVSRLFDDVTTSMKLQRAVSGVVDCRLSTALKDMWTLYNSAEFHIMSYLRVRSLTLRPRDCQWIKELTKVDSCLDVYFAAVVFLHVAYKTARNSLNDKLIDVLATTLGHFIGERCHYNQLSSVLSLSQAAM